MVAIIRRLFGYPRRLKVAEVALLAKLNRDVAKMREAETQRRAIMYTPPPLPPDEVRMFYMKTTAVVAPRDKLKWVVWGERRLLDILATSERSPRVLLDRSSGTIILPAGFAYTLQTSAVLRSVKLQPLSVTMAWNFASGQLVTRKTFVVHPSAYGEPHVFTAELPQASIDREVRLCVSKIDGHGVLEIGKFTGVIVHTRATLVD